MGCEFGLQCWLERSAENRRKWTANKVNAQLRRLMLMQFLGKAWDTMQEDAAYERLHSHAWIRTGCLLTADGTDDAEVRPQGLADYKVPAVGDYEVLD